MQRLDGLPSHTAAEDAAGKLVLACYLAESMQSGGDVEDEALDMLIKF